MSLPAVEAGARFGRWTLRHPLGQGAMAEVWQGEDAEGGTAAVKVLREPSELTVQRFAAEVAALERLAHPGVVRLLAAGPRDPRPWLAMEQIPGPDVLALGERLRARPVAERIERARQIGDQLAAALAYLHDCGLVHRDVKPANVLWAAGRAVLADFGVVGPAQVEERGFVGTWAWAAPEQLLGEVVDARADQFGYGLVLYWLLTGQRAFDEHRRTAPRQRARSPHERDPTVPADLEAVVLRCLAPEPEARFPSMHEVRAALLSLAPVDAQRLAGRQDAADRLSAALDRLADGEGGVIQLQGARGAGQDWLRGLARGAASRRELSCVVEDDPFIVGELAQRVAAGEPLLVVTECAQAGAEVIRLDPLAVADVRRSLYAAAPGTPDLAAAAEALRRWSGGHADLVELALREAVQDGRFEPGRLPVPDLEPWLRSFDYDAQCVAQALAALAQAATAATVEAVAAGTADTLPELERAGLAERLGDRWWLAAEAFRQPLLALAVDPEALCARAAAASGPPPADDPVLAAARAHVDAGRHDEAVRTLLASIDPALGAADTRAERRLLLAALHWYLRDPQGAEVQWTAVRAESGQPRLRARAGVGLGVLALQAGQLDRALDALTHAELDAELAGDLRTLTLACIDLGEVRGLRMQVAEALRVGRRARNEARALRDVSLEAKAARHLGQLLLDTGELLEAERSLADASTLARSAKLDEERLAAHTLRALGVLEARPGDRTAASVALDRLAAVGGRLHDPEGFGALALAVRAEANLALGDRERAVALNLEAGRLPVPPAMALRVGLQRGRVFGMLGDVRAAGELLAEVEGAAAGMGAVGLAWLAAARAAKLRGLSPSTPTGEGGTPLEPAAIAGMLARV